MKLYEINEKINEILNGAVINEETGEMIIDLKKLESLEMAKSEKMKGVIEYYLDLKGDIDKFTNEIKNLQAKKKTLENTRESIKRFLDNSHRGQKATYDTHSISYRKSVVVSGDNVESLPENLYKIDKKPLKSEIKNYLKAGNTIDGWEIVENQSIQIK